MAETHSVDQVLDTGYENYSENQNEKLQVLSSLSHHLGAVQRIEMRINRLVKNVITSEVEQKFSSISIFRRIREEILSCTFLSTNSIYYTRNK